MSLSILKAARQLISDESRWTKGQPARDDCGYAVDAKSDKAVCFCSIGAVSRVCADTDGFVTATEELDIAAEDMGYKSIVNLNDSATHSIVLEAFDKAIANNE